MITREVALWNAYGTDRAYILKLLGFSRFECDMYAHTEFVDLPKKVRKALEASCESHGK